MSKHQHTRTTGTNKSTVLCKKDIAMKPSSTLKRSFTHVLSVATMGAVLVLSPVALAQQSMSYTYNDQGQVLTQDGSRTDVSDITSYTYDASGNRTSITNALGHTIQLADYNGRGQPGRILDANGIETLLTYHVRGWLLSATVVHPSGNSTLDSLTEYTYDNVGQLIEVRLPNGSALAYEYDTARRLVAVSNNLGIIPSTTRATVHKKLLAITAAVFAIP